MTAPKLVRAAAKLLAEEELDGPDTSATGRTRTVDAIKVELSRRAQRGRRRRWALPLVAVAAAVALVGVGASAWSRHTASPVVTAPAATRPSAVAVVADAVRGTVFVEQNGERIPLRSLAVVASGGTVLAMDGEAILVLRSGSRVDIEHATTASVIEQGETELIDVERGAVTSTVTKRGPTERFIVRTADAEVEVRGTVFRVSRLEDPRCGLQTRVHVDEGRVVVRAVAQDGTTLERGGDWVSRCLIGPAPATQPAPTIFAPPNPAQPPASATASLRQAPAVMLTPPATSGTTSWAAAPAAPSVAPSGSTSSDLAAQNALFADAMASKTRGDNASALTSLEFLLQKYPRTPLREAAEAQRMRLVATSDPARAAGLAQGYLLRYPHGFARADAEKIVGASP